MSDNMLQHVESVLADIREQGLYKEERHSKI